MVTALPRRFKTVLSTIMGDPSSVESEIRIKALSLKETYNQYRPIIISNTKVLTQDKYGK